MRNFVRPVAEWKIEITNHDEEKGERVMHVWEYEGMPLTEEQVVEEVKSAYGVEKLYPTSHISIGSIWRVDVQS